MNTISKDMSILTNSPYIKNFRPLGRGKLEIGQTWLFHGTKMDLYVIKKLNVICWLFFKKYRAIAPWNYLAQNHKMATWGPIDSEPKNVINEKIAIQSVYIDDHFYQFSFSFDFPLSSQEGKYFEKYLLKHAINRVNTFDQR